MALVIDRKEVHDLIDRMSAEQLPAAASLLKAMLSGPDDEPVTEEDIQRLRDVRTALARREMGTPMEEFMAELGITMEDLATKK